MPGQESDRGYTSYTGSCSVHGTLKRHISSGIDTTIEDDVFDDFSTGAEIKENGGPGFPIVTGMYLETMQSVTYSLYFPFFEMNI